MADKKKTDADEAAAKKRQAAARKALKTRKAREAEEAQAAQAAAKKRAASKKKKEAEAEAEKKKKTAARKAASNPAWSKGLVEPLEAFGAVAGTVLLRNAIGGIKVKRPEKWEAMDWPAEVPLAARIGPLYGPATSAVNLLAVPYVLKQLKMRSWVRPSRIGLSVLLGVDLLVGLSALARRGFSYKDNPRPLPQSDKKFPKWTHYIEVSPALIEYQADPPSAMYGKGRTSLRALGDGSRTTSMELVRDASGRLVYAPRP